MRRNRNLQIVVVLACVALLATACTKSSTGNGGGGGGQPTGTGSVQPTASLQPSETPTQSSSETGDPTPEGDLSGKWSGTWANSTPDTSTGTFELTWQQNGTALIGTIVIDGTPCLSGGAVTGKLRGSLISFGVVSGQVEVNYAGTFSGDTMSGSYATSCGNAGGEWTATKTG